MKLKNKMKLWTNIKFSPNQAVKDVKQSNFLVIIKNFSY
jgi:hypothetical protein